MRTISQINQIQDERFAHHRSGVQIARLTSISVLFISVTQKIALAFASAFFNDVFRFAERDVRFARDGWLRQVMCPSGVMCAFGT